jgi:hypothetical protein
MILTLLLSSTVPTYSKYFSLVGPPPSWYCTSAPASSRRRLRRLHPQPIRREGRCHQGRSGCFPRALPKQSRCIGSDSRWCGGTVPRRFMGDTAVWFLDASRPRRCDSVVPRQRTAWFLKDVQLQNRRLSQILQHILISSSGVTSSSSRVVSVSAWSNSDWIRWGDLRELPSTALWSAPIPFWFPFLADLFPFLCNWNLMSYILHGWWNWMRLTAGASWVCKSLWGIGFSDFWSRDSCYFWKWVCSTPFLSLVDWFILRWNRT